MKLQQLRFLRQVVESGFNVTAAAEALHTSQSGVSRQIRLLEDELGATIFNRQRKRLLGLTDVGAALAREAIDIVERAEQLKSVAADFDESAGGELTVATTHLHARYALLPVVREFSRRHETVALRLIQTFPDEIFQLLDHDQADIGITTEAPADIDRFESLAVYRMKRCLIAPQGHPLLRMRRPSLADVAGHPLILYDNRLSSGRDVTRAFASAGIEPNAVLKAFDVDVIKAYVHAGLGVAIVPSLAFDRRRDSGLSAIALDHIFPEATTSVVIRRGKYLRRYARAFVDLVLSAKAIGRDAPGRRPPERRKGTAPGAMPGHGLPAKRASKAKARPPRSG